MNHRNYQFLDPQGRQFGFKFLHHCDKSTPNFRMFFLKILEETGFEDLPEQTYNNLELWYRVKSIYNIRDNSGQEIDVAVLETCFHLSPDFEDFYSRITYMVSGGKPLEDLSTSEPKPGGIQKPQNHERLYNLIRGLRDCLFGQSLFCG